MDVVKAIQSSIEIVAKLRKLVKLVEDAEAKMLLADLTDKLADAKLDAAHLKMQIAELTDANRSMANQQVVSDLKPVVFEEAYRFADDDSLFCTACFDTQRKKIRLTEMSGPFKVFGKRSCPVCKATYGK